MQTESFISLQEASKLYKVSRRTVERLIKHGDLPYHRIGRQIRLVPADLDRATRQHPNEDARGFGRMRNANRIEGDRERPSSTFAFSAGSPSEGG
jgi:excisionase family DNA binding protein